VDIFLLIIRMVFALGLVMALAYFSLRLGLPRLYPSGTEKKIVSVIERTALAPKVWVYVVKVGEELLLVGVNGTSITYLKELPPELGEGMEEGDMGPKDLKDFGELLKAKLKKEGAGTDHESTGGHE